VIVCPIFTLPASFRPFNSITVPSASVNWVEVSAWTTPTILTLNEKLSAYAPGVAGPCADTGAVCKLMAAAETISKAAIVSNRFFLDTGIFS